MTHANASAKAEKILGAERRPKGRAVSMYVDSLHTECQQRVIIRMNRQYAVHIFRSIFASKVPGPRLRTTAAAVAWPTHVVDTVASGSRQIRYQSPLVRLVRLRD